MPITFTPDQLAEYFSGQYVYPCKQEAVDKAAEMRVHANGDFPERLISTRRPHESDLVLEYRKAIWEAKTKPTFGKVMSSLGKIRRSSEWSIRFENEVPKTISETENLSVYITSKFPGHTSITNWAFSVLLREYAIDGNAWVAVLPDETEIAENSYYTPKPVIFCVERVVDYGPDYLIVKSHENSTYYNTGSTEPQSGDIYYVITDTTYYRYEQTTATRKFALAWQQEHSIGQLPAFKMRGVAVKTEGDYTINETRLAPMLPSLNEAVREYSDLQAEVVQHVHSEKWEVGEKECTHCHGRRVEIGEHGPVPCRYCQGEGYEPRGPYTVYKVDKPMAGETGGPIPPMGYLQKDTAIVTIQDKRVQQHLTDALAAINMEFLAQTPINESGIAKAYDADETNNFVHGVAEDIVAMLDSVVFYTSELRYSVVVPNQQDRIKLLPKIAVPDQFDLFSARMVGEELTNAKTAGVNPVILNAMEEEYANKKFNNDPSVRAKISLIFRLDPLANITEENKVMMLQNGGITKETYIVSCNIQAFVTRALEEKGPAFFTLNLAQQKEIIYGYATEQIDATSVGKQIISNVVGG